MSDISRLVLTRKLHQSINIGGIIAVTVEEIRGKVVRISVEAPRGIAVHRREIYERIVSGGEEGGSAGMLVPAGPERPPGRLGARLRREVGPLENVPVSGLTPLSREIPGLHPGEVWDDPL